MTDLFMVVSRSGLGSLLMFGAVMAAAPAGDLSSYRNFKLAADLTAVTKQVG